MRAYARDLADFASFVGTASTDLAIDGLTALTAPQAHAVAYSYRAHLLARRLASATVARRLAALRSVVRLARQLGRCNWALEVDAPRVEQLRDTRGPGEDGWRRLLEWARGQTGVKGLRDLALVRFIHDLALRRSEAVGARLEDLDLAGVPPTAAILGKGRTDRERLTIPPPTIGPLWAWIEARGDRPGPLFHRLDRAAAAGGPIRGLSGRSVARLIGELGRRAGLARPVRPHGLRHQAITRALDLTGGDVRKVQRFARHRSPATTLKYDDNRRDLAGELARLVAED